MRSLSVLAVAASCMLLHLLSVLWIALTINVYLLCVCNARPVSQVEKGRRRLIRRIQNSIAPTTASGQFPTFTPKKIKKTLQSWVIRQNGYDRNAQLIGRMRAQRSSKTREWMTASELMARNGKCRGSFLTFSKPSKDQLWEWLGVKDLDENETLKCLLSRQKEKVFNHKLAGMTNPLLHVSPESDGQTVPVNLHNPSSRGLSNDCWPSLVTSPNGEITMSLKRNSRKRHIILNAIPYLAVRRDEWKGIKQQSDDWRILVWREIVGTGHECYERVRDAALDWEFKSADGSTGIMQIPSTPPRRSSRYDRTILPNRKAQRRSSGLLPKPYVPSATSRYSIRSVDMPIASSGSDGAGIQSGSIYHRSLGSTSRRLVTFTSSFGQKLYIVNPVAVLYDVVDQRAPGSLYTSTAYGTMKGHWLRGEERVTVRWHDRDGGQVDVEIFSASRAAPSLISKFVWRLPNLRNKQNAFFRAQLEHLQNVAAMSESTAVGASTAGT